MHTRFKAIISWNDSYVTINAKSRQIKHKQRKEHRQKLWPEQIEQNLIRPLSFCSDWKSSLFAAVKHLSLQGIQEDDAKEVNNQSPCLSSNFYTFILFYIFENCFNFSVRKNELVTLCTMLLDLQEIEISSLWFLLNSFYSAVSFDCFTGNNLSFQSTKFYSFENKILYISNPGIKYFLCIKELGLEQAAFSLFLFVP